MRSSPHSVEPAQCYELNSTKQSVADLDAFPNLEHVENIADWSRNHWHLHCCVLTLTLAPEISWANTLLSRGNAMLRVCLRGIYKTVQTTHLQCVKGTSVITVGSRRRVRRLAMNKCWRKKTPRCISKRSKTGIVCRSSWLARNIVRL
jgi:hypothetical protein